VRRTAYDSLGLRLAVSILFAVTNNTEIIMNRILFPAMVLALLLGPVAATQAQATKIAVVNPIRVFKTVKENEAVSRRLEGEMRSLSESVRAKQETARQIKTELDTLKPDSPQYAEKRQQMIRAAGAAKMEQELAKLQANTLEVTGTLALHDKISAAVAEVAKEKGVDLVIVQLNPEVPASGEGLTTNQLNELLLRRNVVYAGPNVDITDAVIAKMDAQFAAAGGK
jgi:Skp family chaperone for outer membrane proteins